MKKQRTLERFFKTTANRDENQPATTSLSNKSTVCETTNEDSSSKNLPPENVFEPRCHEKVKSQDSSYITIYY